MKTQQQATSLERQLDQFVNREVIYNVNELMTKLYTSDDYENIYDAFQNLQDYKTPVKEWLLNATEHEKNELKTIEVIEDLKDMTEGDYMNACSYLDLNDQVDQEILEYWIVTEYLADKLIEQGEPVAKDIHGLTVWGRTCSGQAISIDGVIGRIYKELMR